MHAGVDQSVCVVLALLLACYDFPASNPPNSSRTAVEAASANQQSSGCGDIGCGDIGGMQSKAGEGRGGCDSASQSSHEAGLAPVPHVSSLSEGPQRAGQRASCMQRDSEDAGLAHRPRESLSGGSRGAVQRASCMPEGLQDAGCAHRPHGSVREGSQGDGDEASCLADVQQRPAWRHEFAWDPASGVVTTPEVCFFVPVWLCLYEGEGVCMCVRVCTCSCNCT